MAKTPAWTRKEGKSEKGGLNAKGRASYNAANPGKPGLKAPQPEGGSRKKSFCARMSGMKKKLTSAKTANDPDSRINKSLRAWKCQMTTSSVTTFNLDLNNLIEEAFERCGSELRSGYDMRTARRSLNLLTIEWANRGINLWTIEQGQIPLTTGQISYPIPTDTIDLLDHVVRTGSDSNQIDINISRISESTYSTLPNKNAQGRPIQVWVNRQTGVTRSTANTTLAASISATATTIDVTSAVNLPAAGFITIGTETIAYQNVSSNQLLNCYRAQNNTTAATHTIADSIFVTNLPNINIWPTGDGSGPYTFVYWRLRRMQDAGDGSTTQDIPFRFLPALVAGLSVQLALKLPGGFERLQVLKMAYDEQWMLASDEDREKAPLRLAPRVAFN